MNLSLPLISFITFKTIASPYKFWSNSQPKYVAFKYCLILTSPYCMSKVPIFLFLFLVGKRIDLTCYFRHLVKWQLERDLNDFSRTDSQKAKQN